MVDDDMDLIKEFRNFVYFWWKSDYNAGMLELMSLNGLSLVNNLQDLCRSPWDSDMEKLSHSSGGTH